MRCASRRNSSAIGTSSCVGGRIGIDRPPGITPFSLPPAAHAAGVLEDLVEPRAERQLEEARALDVTGDTEDRRARALLGAARS